MGKHYDALRKKCPCQYCQAETANNNWAVEHRPCVTPSPMQAYEEAAERLESMQVVLTEAREQYNGVEDMVPEVSGMLGRIDQMLVPSYCTRKALHDGPCNGWPMETCKLNRNRS